jgi:hypothetical protein
MLINAIQLKRANDEQSSYMSKDKAMKSYRYNQSFNIKFIIDYFYSLENNLINKLMMLKHVLKIIGKNKK